MFHTSWNSVNLTLSCIFIIKKKGILAHMFIKSHCKEGAVERAERSVWTLLHTDLDLSALSTACSFLNVSWTGMKLNMRLLPQSLNRSLGWSCPWVWDRKTDCKSIIWWRQQLRRSSKWMNVTGFHWKVNVRIKSFKRQVNPFKDKSILCVYTIMKNIWWFMVQVFFFSFWLCTYKEGSFGSAGWVIKLYSGASM